MKHYIMLLILLLAGTPHALWAQAFVVRADKMNLVYTGIDNPLTIVSGKCSCKDLSVTTDIGELKKLEGCNYLYRGAATEGRMTLTISQTTGGKTKEIGTQFFRVKRMNEPYATVGGRKGNYYSLASFKVQKGVSVTIDNFESMEPRYMVTKFNVRVLRKGSAIFNAVVKGMYFNKECTDFFSTLKAGDVVEISGINCISPDSRERHLPDDLIFTMI